MFARALREFILRPEPCTKRMCMTKDVCAQCTRRRGVGSPGRLFAGRLVLMLQLAGTQLPAQTEQARVEEMYSRRSEGHVKERRTPRASGRATCAGRWRSCPVAGRLQGV